MICLVLTQVLHKQDSHSMSVGDNPCYPANKTKMKHLLTRALKKIKTLINILQHKQRDARWRITPNNENKRLLLPTQYSAYVHARTCGFLFSDFQYHDNPMQKKFFSP